MSRRTSTVGGSVVSGASTYDVGPGCGASGRGSLDDWIADRAARNPPTVRLPVSEGLRSFGPRLGPSFVLAAHAASTLRADPGNAVYVRELEEKLVQPQSSSSLDPRACEFRPCCSRVDKHTTEREVLTAPMVFPGTFDTIVLPPVRWSHHCYEVITAKYIVIEAARATEFRDAAVQTTSGNTSESSGSKVSHTVDVARLCRRCACELPEGFPASECRKCQVELAFPGRPEQVRRALAADGLGSGASSSAASSRPTPFTFTSEYIPSSPNELSQAAADCKQQ